MGTRMSGRRRSKSGKGTKENKTRSTTMAEELEASKAEDGGENEKGREKEAR